MYILPGDTALRQCIPNVLKTVEGETTLFNKLYPFMEKAEMWLIDNIVSETVINHWKDLPENNAFKLLSAKIIVSQALLNAIPSIDLVLTPNGFGVVNTNNIAPASKDRVERLLTSIENERDSAIELLLPKMITQNGWRDTQQGDYFAATLFPNLSLCRRLAIRQHLWEEYQAKRERLIKIENVLAETYFSQEQMTVFRDKAIHLLTDCHPTMLHVIRSLQSLLLMLVSDMQVHTQSYFDLVNIIREHDEIFPEWHASTTAQLYIPTTFSNKKTSGGYWF